MDSDLVIKDDVIDLGYENTPAPGGDEPQRIKSSENLPLEGGNVEAPMSAENTPLEETKDPEHRDDNTGPPPKEVSPHGRYVKLDERLGAGAYKDVWRAYDTLEGMEVAWNVVKLSRIPPSERKRIKTEVKLLKDLEHRNVIKYYSSWVDREKEQIVSLMFCIHVFK